MNYYEDDKYYKLWNEEHPQFRDWIDRINNFAQGDGIMEDDVDVLQCQFEDGDYDELYKRLDRMKDEVQDLYFAIDNAYDYIEKLKNKQKRVEYIFEKIKGNDDEFDFTISKDGEVLCTIHYDREKRSVSEFPHFYSFNDYNKNKFNRVLSWILNKNKLVLEFYEKV